MTVEQKLGRRIAQLRQKAGMTQAQLAEASDYSEDCIAMTALLEVMRPMQDALAKLAKRLTAAKELKPQI